MYKLFRKGSALNLVIIMILVMTIIGLPLLSMVVINYRLRALDIALKKAEYKNEMLMDQVYIAIQRSVISAINDAKEIATVKVDDEVEAQKDEYTEYTRLYNEYKNAWINEKNLAGEEYTEEELNAYLEDSLGDLTANLSVIDVTTGQTIPLKLQEAYNNAFKKEYLELLSGDNAGYAASNSNVYYSITEPKSQYSNVITNYTENLSFKTGKYNSEKVTSADGAMICTDTTKDIENNNLVVHITSLYKGERVATVMLSADFVVRIPEFNTISEIEQKTVTFSNPLLNHTLIADEMLTIQDGTVKVDGHAIAKGGVNIDSEFIIDGKLSTEGDIVLTGTLETGSFPIYYNNLYLAKNNADVDFGGDVYARDDLEINNDVSKFNVYQEPTHNYYGFNDVNDLGADASSSIIINTTGAIDSSSSISLGNLYLAGRAFMKDVKSTISGKEYKTGESVSIKGNYIAYQTPVTVDKFEDKVVFGDYLYSDASGRKIAMNQVERFLEGKTNPDKATWEKMTERFGIHKWEYFVAYANKYMANIIKPNIYANQIKYMQGAGVLREGTETEVSVKDSKTNNIDDPAFKTNANIEFEAQTKYYGYYTNQKDILFGDNGWLKNITSEIIAPRVYVTNKDIVFDDTNSIENYDIVITTKDIDIEASTDASNPTKFSGTIIAGGDINITGNLNISTAKTTIMDYILFGADNANSGLENYEAYNKLLKIFAYDNSGTTYIITKTTNNDSLVSINNLIGITNWKKQDRGFF